MKFVSKIFFSLFLMGCTTQQIQQALGTVMEEKLTTEDVANGLKEALTKGITNGANKASALNGFLGNPQIKIPFPPDVKKVEDKLRQIGMGNQVDKFIETLNRGAEEAANEAKPIFVTAITSMTIQDAWGILKGEDNAATQYLQKTTATQLREKFKPVIKRALDKTSATKYYTDIVNAYNKLPLVEKVNPSLEDYATDRALTGLFTLVAQEELKIREDPLARTTDLLKRVFKEQD